MRVNPSPPRLLYLRALRVKHFCRTGRRQKKAVEYENSRIATTFRNPRVRQSAAMLGMPTSPLAAACGEAVEVFATEIETVRHEGSLGLLAYWAQCRAAKGDLVVGEDLPAPAVRKIMSALCL